MPLAPLLGLWAAVASLIPQIGGALAGAPFVLLGFTEGATTGVICLIAFVLYLNFENHILSPIIVGEAVDLSAPTTMVGAIVGRLGGRGARCPGVGPAARGGQGHLPGGHRPGPPEGQGLPLGRPPPPPRFGPPGTKSPQGAETPLGSLWGWPGSSIS